MAFRFSKNGTFLNAIGQAGGGTGRVVERWILFRGKDCVYVCDMGKRTIYSYSLMENFFIR